MNKEQASNTFRYSITNVLFDVKCYVYWRKHLQLILRLCGHQFLGLTNSDVNIKIMHQLFSYISPVKRICVFEHSVMTNFNCACPAIQRGYGSGFLSEGSSWLAARICDKYQIRLTRSIWRFVWRFILYMQSRSTFPWSVLLEKFCLFYY